MLWRVKQSARRCICTRYDRAQDWGALWASYDDVGLNEACSILLIACKGCVDAVQELAAR